MQYYIITKSCDTGFVFLEMEEYSWYINLKTSYRAICITLFLLKHFYMLMFTWEVIWKDILKY